MCQRAEVPGIVGTSSRAAGWLTSCCGPAASIGLWLHPVSRCRHLYMSKETPMLNPSAVLYGPHDVRIEDRPVPEPAPGQVLVEIAAIGICGSDVHYYEHGRIGDYVVRDPMIIGHESAGTVVDVGDGVDRNRVGELVALEPGVPCRSCTQCLRGRYNLCPRIVFFATPPVDGSISHYVAIDAAFAHSALPGLTAEQAAMAEPVSVGIWAARKGAITAGDRV